MILSIRPAKSLLRPLILATGIASLLSASAQAAAVTLTAANVINTTSFNTSLSWSDGAAPNAANDYFTGAFLLRTPATGGPFTFAGNSLSLDTGGALAFKVASVITVNNLILNGGELNNFDTGGDQIAKIAGTMTVNADSRINASTASRSFRIDSLIQGTAGLTLLGAGTGQITFANPANTFTGPITLNGGGVLAVATIGNGGAASLMGAAPSDADRLVLNGGTLRINGGGGSTDRLFTMNANGALDSSGTGAVLFTNSGTIAHTGTGARTLTLTGSNRNDNTFAPVLGDGPGVTNLTKNGAGTWIVTGVNSYTGATNVNTGILRINNAGALGTTGTVTVNGNTTNNGILELTGGINLAKNFTLIARQLATADIPHIRSVSGNNSITGTINLTTGGSFYNIESASAGETLTINGDIVGSTLTSGNRQPRFMGAGDGVLNGNLVLPTGSAIMDIFKEGSGTWTLNGTAGHTGATVVRGGTLVLGAAATLTGTSRIQLGTGATLNASAVGGVTLNPGAILEGFGTVTGNVADTFGARIVPGTETTPGVLTLTGNLTLNGGTTIAANFGNATTPGGGGNDLISVASNLTTSGSTIVEFHPGGNALAGSYRLINYGGTASLGGTFDVLNDTRYTVFTDTTTPGQVNVVVSGSAGNLVWSGATPDWDLKNSTNWNSGNAVFFEADNVTFNDTGATTAAVNLIGTLLPGNVTVDAAANYSFSGAGKISGAAGIAKSGTGTLTISTANDFHGPVTVSGGKLTVGSAAALGSTVGGTTVSSGATLDLNSFLLPAGEIVAISGAGVGGAGAVVNNGVTGGVGVGLRNLVLVGNASIGGTERWDIRDTPGGLDGAGHSLTKVGANTVFLKDIGETHVGNLIVSEGTLGFEGNTTFGDGVGTVQVAALGTISLYNSTLTGTKAVQLQGGAIGTLTGAGTANTLVAPIILQEPSILGPVTGTTIRLNGVISGGGDLSIFGGGTGIFGGTDANTFTGAIMVTQGTLQLSKTAGTAAISGDLVAAGGTVAMLAANQFGPNASVTIDAGGTWSNGSNFEQTLPDFTVNTSTLQSLNALNVTNLFSITAGLHDLNSGQSSTAHALSISGGGNFRLGANSAPSTMNIGAGGLTLADGTLQLGQTGGTVTALVTLGGNVTGSGTSAIFNPNTSGPRILDLLGETRTFSITDGTTTVSPTIDNGGVTKSGAGTLVLSGASTYTGATTVTAGVLLVNGSISGSTVTVNSGATLGGSGTINGDVIVHGTFEPGSSLSPLLTLGLTDLTLGSSSTSTFELAGLFSFDSVTSIDQLTLDGTFNVTLFGGYIPNEGDSFDLLEFAAVNALGFNVGTDLILPDLGPGLSWDHSRFVSEGVLTVIPEPGVSFALLSGFSLLGGMRRFRRR